MFVVEEKFIKMRETIVRDVTPDKNKFIIYK